MSRGQKPHVPTKEKRAQVESMAGFGIPEPDIARSIGVSRNTMRKYYADELDLGHVKANSAVAQSLYKKAVSDGPQSVTAAIFWLKVRAGWKDTTVVENVGKDGGPIEYAKIERVIVDSPHAEDRDTPRLPTAH